MIVTDGAFGAQIDPHNQILTLRTMNVTTFVVGVGVWLQVSSCRSLASNNGNYYGTWAEWSAMLSDTLSSITPGQV